MKNTIILFFLSLCSVSAQVVTFTYTLDTVHSGGVVRVDSFYLTETTTGSLIETGALTSPGGRSQQFANPILFTDTAQLTAFYLQLKADSIALLERSNVLRDQAAVAGAKYRAVWYLADSVFYGYTGGPRSLRLPPPDEDSAPLSIPAPAPEAAKKPKAVTGKKGTKKKQ